MEGYYKVKVKKGTKNGFTCKWSDKSKWIKTINFKKYNGAILTGSVNNLIVLDVDVSKKKDEVKADGITEFDKYIEQYGEPLTYKVKTPSGGFHYYFKFENSDIAAKQIIKDSLPNASGYRNAGLDIRTNGGLIIMAGSTIYNVGHYEVIRDVPLIEMPLTLLEWLTDAEANCSTTEKPQSIKKKLGNVEDVQRDYTYYDLTDEKIIEILTLLPAKYKDNYSDWLKVLTVMKHHNKKKLWDKYSKGSYHYNKAKNYSMWDRNKGIFNINYLVSVLRSMGHKIDFFKRYKAYEPITKVINNINKINCNYTYISEAIPYELYKQHNTIILQSSTGTGKTTAVAALVAQSMEEYEDFNFLSITTRTTLCDQHMTSFKNIDIQHYQTCTELTEAEALTICLNSLHKLEEIEEEDMKNYIIYIDEVKAFLEMTHNKTLDSRLKQTMEVLMNFIDNAAKVIVSDAIIDDNCFEFLKNRNNILFIENAYQKYKDIEAIRLRNEHDFRDALVEHCEMGKPFLFGCDSKDTVSSLFHYCQKRAGDDKNDKFLLITDEYRGTLDNASELFKDKFVFYSPKITFGVDFSISEKQDVFIYIKGGSIQPHGMFQQATRCRNIDKLYYYGEVAEQSYIFNNIEEAKDDIREGAKMTEEFKTACTYLDERNKVRIIENTFFNLFCYNEYVMDCYRTNKLKHFELILIKNGMTLSEKGEPVRMNKKTKEEMHTVVQSIKEELFEQFLKDDDKTKAEYKQIRDNLEYLKLTHKQCEKHKDIIIDKYKIEEHDNIIRLLKTDDYISRKLERCTETAYDEAVLMCVFSKIKLVRQIEHTYNINLFNLNVKNIDIDMNEQLYKNIRTVFKTTKGKPKDTKELVRLYVGLIRNICGGSLIKAKQLSTKEERNNVIYTLVADNIYYNLELNSYKNKRMTDFIDAVNVEPHRKAERVEFLDKLLDG